MLAAASGAAALAALAAVGVSVRSLSRAHPEPLWDWDDIDTSDLGPFPEGFHWGTATASYQVEGGNHNTNWAWWEKQTDPKTGKPKIHEGDKAGAAAEHWERYAQDVQQMKAELGVNAYRFSLAWGRIEPEPGKFDESAIAHYHDVIDALLAAGITPMVTLHHFSHPLWFEEMGSFEKEENLAHQMRFTERMFREYGDKVPWWCTYNEPGPFSTMGWGLGVFPPGKKDPKLLGTVLRNLMVSHARQVELIKGLPHGGDAQVGLVKNIFQFDPWQRWNPVHWVLCRVLDGAYNESIIGALRDGVYRFHVPGVVKIEEEIPGMKQAGDFVGLNYYANLLIDPLMSREPPFDAHTRPGQILTDMPYAIYAEGFWRALHRLNTIGLPIHVTENGIADAKDDRRAIWIERYLYAMSKAMREGVDVRGYYYWSLMDNFEWAEGYAMRFGLFEVDYATQERRLREGSKAYVDIVRRFADGPAK